MLLFAVVRAVEIAGEAASKMSPSVRADHATIPHYVASDDFNAFKISEFKKNEQLIKEAGIKSE